MTVTKDIQAGERTQYPESIRPESRIPKSGLPVYLLFGDKLIRSFKTLEEALRHGSGNLVIESGLNVFPQPFHRAFTMAAYPDQAPFWTETTVEHAVGRALAELIKPSMRKVEPRFENGWKTQYDVSRMGYIEAAETFGTDAAEEYRAEQEECDRIVA